MKISLLILYFLLVGIQDAISAQGLTPSTVRQVFSLERGDSLEYHTQTLETMQGCGVLCDIYRLNVIDSVFYNVTQDALSINFSSQIIYENTFAKAPMYDCDVCHPGFMNGDYFVLSSGLWIVTDLDSTIKYLMDTIYGTTEGFSYDSTYITDNMYNLSKENEYGYGYRMMSDFEEIYVDSIGIVYKTEENQTATNNTEQLIYYHKANGKQWGTPYIISGLDDISKEGEISIYPNPAEGKFIVQSQLYEGMRFRLFDVLSKQVISTTLSGTKTEVERNNLPAGIYFWQVANGVNVIKTGKLIIE